MVTFSTQEICRLTGVSEDTFGVWLTRGTFTPEFVRQGGRGTPRTFTTSDLRHLHFVRQVTQFGVPPNMAERLWVQASLPGFAGKTLVVLPGNSEVQIWADNPSIADLPAIALVIRGAALIEATNARIA